jgi:hypothetical protein
VTAITECAFGQTGAKAKSRRIAGQRGSRSSPLVSLVARMERSDIRADSFRISLALNPAYERLRLM